MKLDLPDYAKVKAVTVEIDLNTVPPGATTDSIINTMQTAFAPLVVKSASTGKRFTLTLGKP